MIVSTAQVIPIYWQTAAGAAATGKVIGNLTYKITLDGVDAGITPTLTDVATVGAWRLYTLNLTSPATVGDIVIHLERGMAVWHKRRRMKVEKGGKA